MLVTPRNIFSPASTDSNGSSVKSEITLGKGACQFYCSSYRYIRFYLGGRHANAGKPLVTQLLLEKLCDS